MRKIGFSHAVLYKVHDVYTKKNIQLFKDCGSNAIEVNFHHANESARLDDIYFQVKDFEYISMHMPCDARYKNNEKTKTLLKHAEKFYQKINAQLAVMHPDMVDDWSVFDGYKINWAIENMDDRKQNFQYADDLENFFHEHDDWSLVLDLGHCNANDKSMKLADDIIIKTKDKIKEVHLSGYKTFHDPLYRTKQTEIIKYCNRLNVPIIIESTFEISDGLEGIQKEYNYILENLK